MSKLFRSIVGYGIALTAVVEVGAACSSRPAMREGPPPPVCNPSTPCSVAGMVVDGAGNPIAGATVRLRDESVKTGADGKFSFTTPLTDTYATEIEVTTLDQRRARERVSFNFGGSQQVTIKIEDPPAPPDPPQPPPVT